MVRAGRRRRTLPKWVEQWEAASKGTVFGPLVSRQTRLQADVESDDATQADFASASSSYSLYHRADESPLVGRTVSRSCGRSQSRDNGNL